MKRRFARGSLVAAIVGTLFAASGHAVQRGPRLEIEPGEWDFGRAAPGTVLVREFALKNTGSRDLEIGRIASACACAAAVTDRTVVPPGEAATLRVTLETRRYRGVLERWLTIRSNDSRSATRLKVRVYVEDVPQRASGAASDPAGIPQRPTATR